MDDIPWLYVAMIFIAFVSWVSNRIKEAAEYRRQVKAERASEARSRNSTSAPEWESPYRKSSAAPPAQPQPEEEPPKSFQDVFRELERQISDPATASSSKSAPPPLPSGAESPQESIGQMPDLPDEPVIPSPPLKGHRKRERTSAKTGGSASSLPTLLRDGNQLRTALILKEVLDSPKALRR